ncbi:MAG: hypothetical protein AB7O78_03980 [Thermoleophilia bacterium]
MAHVNGIAGAGNAEATRLQQTVAHRGAETAALVVVGRREDRLRAERIPEAETGDRIGDREAGGGAGGDASGDDGRGQGHEAGAPEEGHGGLIDLRA